MIGVDEPARMWERHEAAIRAFWAGRLRGLASLTPWELRAPQAMDDAGRLARTRTVLASLTPDADNVTLPSVFPDFGTISLPKYWGGTCRRTIRLHGASAGARVTTGCRLDAPALPADNAGMKKKQRLQYTIRDIPERTDRRLREVAAEYGASLNSTAIRVLNQALGLDAEPVVHRDLDDLIGSWVSDPELDKALEEMDRVDAELWK